MPTHVTAQLSSVWDYTGAPATNNVESADVYTWHQLGCECWDVSLKVIPGCVHSSIWWMPAGCQRAACLTSKSWLLHSSPVCSSDITHVTVYCLCCRFRCRNSERIPEAQFAEDASRGSHLNIYITGTVLQHTDSTKLFRILPNQFKE